MLAVLEPSVPVVAANIGESGQWSQKRHLTHEDLPLGSFFSILAFNFSSPRSAV